MPIEPQAEAKSRRTRWFWYLNLALYQLMNPRFRSILIAVALVEALGAPFIGQRFALAAIATGMVSIGLTVAVVGFQLDTIVQLYNGELQKMRDVSAKPAAEQPLSPFFKN